MARTARALLLSTVSEEELAQHCKRLAHRYGWEGIHTRYSLAVLESVHTKPRDGFSEAFGMPDWYWWSPDLEESFWSELKSARGVLSKDQKRTIASLRKAGQIVFIWRPVDDSQIEHVFKYGPRVVHGA